MTRVFLPYACLFAAATAQGAPDSAQLEFFERSVRPVLAEHCYQCHGPETQKSSLRVDHIEYLLKGGETDTALVPGDAGASRLIAAIRYNNVDFQMPPKGRLSDTAIAALEEWVAAGAPWPEEPLPEATNEAETFNLEQRREEHWAWRPVRDVAPPEVAHGDWPKDDVDRFILAKLEEKGLKPAPRASETVLLRRLHFDLTGLPPTPEEVSAYLEDDSPDAYEKAVDRLLASPAYGERWGRHWLDLVRYAETYGHEQDYPVRHAWKYRDYVIRAMNDDVPYDQLIREHIAGDLLPDPRMNEAGLSESILATGFWFFHQATHAPVDVAQDHADRIDNQIEVMTKAFQAMTVSCARCHDHKFDAVSEVDYYAMAGYLRSSRQDFPYLDPQGAIAETAATLSDKRQEGQALLHEVLQQTRPNQAQQTETFLRAAHEVLFGQWQPEDGPAGLRGDIPFAGFESGLFDGWQVEGDAFGGTPATETLRPQAQVENSQGNFFANSYHGGDEPRGRLLSRPFVIERDFIRFRVGGGDHPGETCVNLLVDGENVLSQTGGNSGRLLPIAWNASAWKGRQAQIEVLDDRGGEWGYIVADDFVFSDRESATSHARPLENVAAQFDLDSAGLEAWTRALQRAANEPAHPLAPLWRVMATAPGDEGVLVEQALNAIGESEAANAAALETYHRESVLFEDFDRDLWEDWTLHGEAFGDGPAQPGDWFPDGARAAQHTKHRAAHSGLTARKLQGALRSKSFTLTHDNLHFRMAGEGGQIRLVVNDYQLREYNGLLFGQTLVNVDTDGNFVWHNMTRDISKFKGRDAYIEIIDDGDGWVAVDEIRFSDGEPPGVWPNPIAQWLASEGRAATRDELISRYGTLTDEALAAFGSPELSSNGAYWLHWLAREGMIRLPFSGMKLEALAAACDTLAGKAPAPERVLAMTDGTPMDNPVFIRGNYKTPGKPAPRRFLQAIAGPAPDPIGEDQSGRLLLARHITDPENPLTARVAVNRIWHYLFGQGIVPTPDNFGVLGMPPTHPKLLDYLAQEMVANGWSMKQMIRRLVLTETYRMTSSPVDEAAEAADPANNLLHRMRLRRLEGEAIRDALLAVAGELDRTMFGESVPSYVSPYMRGNRPPPRDGPLDGDRRRTVYLEVRRNYLSPMLLAFDLPLPDTTQGKRNQTNIPAQALILMNDPFVVDRARAWSQSLLEAGGVSLDNRIAALYQRAYARAPRPDELETLRAFIDTQRREYGIGEDAVLDDERLWTDVCHVLFTLKEFIYIG